MWTSKHCEYTDEMLDKLCREENQIKVSKTNPHVMITGRYENEIKRKTREEIRRSEEGQTFCDER